MVRKPSVSIAQLCLFAILGALTFGAKFVMSGLPNIEPVSLMVMIFAAVFGVKGLYPIAVYVIMEILVFGPGYWNFNYLYIWSILWLAAWLLRKMRQPLLWAILSGTFGLLFGLLCAPVDVALFGFQVATAKWVSGLGFDLLHCAGNFVIALLLFAPLRTLTEKLYRPLK